MSKLSSTLFSGAPPFRSRLFAAFDNTRVGTSLIVSILLAAGATPAVADPATDCTSRTLPPDTRIAACSAFLQKDPGVGSGYTNRALAYEERDDYRSALLDHTRAIELDSSDAEAWYNRGNVYLKQGEIRKATADYTKAIESDPKPVSAYDNRGTTYQQAGESRKAEADLRKATERDPTIAGKGADPVEPKSVDVYVDKPFTGSSPKGVSSRKATTAHYDRGNRLADRGDDDEAIVAYTKAIELDPRNAMAHLDRSFVYATLGAFGKAIADYRSVLGLKTAHPKQKATASDALKRLGADP